MDLSRRTVPATAGAGVARLERMKFEAQSLEAVADEYQRVPAPEPCTGH